MGMPTPRPGLSLTADEVALMRRCLLTITETAEAIRQQAAWTDDARRLFEAADGIAFLLDRAEARRAVQ